VALAKPKVLDVVDMTKTSHTVTEEVVQDGGPRLTAEETLENQACGVESMAELASPTVMSSPAFTSNPAASRNRGVIASRCGWGELSAVPFSGWSARVPEATGLATGQRV